MPTAIQQQGYYYHTPWYTCPYGNTAILPKSMSQISEDTSLCSFFNRKGLLCGVCAENYTFPAYSYYFGSVKCENYNGWLKFIAAAFLPLTLLYILVMISVTSSAFNAFVMVSQISASPPVIRHIYSSNLVTDPYHVHSCLFNSCLQYFPFGTLTSFEAGMHGYIKFVFIKRTCLSMLLVSIHYSSYYLPSSWSNFMIILLLLLAFGGHFTDV